MRDCSIGSTPEEPIHNWKDTVLARITASLLLIALLLFAFAHFAVSDEVSILRFRGSAFLQEEGKKYERIQKKGLVSANALLKTGRDSEILLQCGQLYYMLHSYSKVKIKSAPFLLYGKLSQAPELSFLTLRFFFTPQPAQGKTLKIVLLSDSPITGIDAVILDEHGNDRSISFYSFGKNSYRALTGFDVEARPEKYHLKITAEKKTTAVNSTESKNGIDRGTENRDDLRTTILYPFYLRKTPYESGKVYLPEEKKELLSPSKKKDEERRTLWQIVTKASQDALWEGAFGFPVQDPLIISDFGKRRVYYMKKVRPFIRFHRGIDFQGERGEPIFTPNSGVIAFADQRITTGYTLVVDHGQGVFSLFFHLNSIDVKEGDRVKKGDMIGTIGSTGVAAGPHLHWGLMVNGIYVDPSDWIDRVF